MECYGPTGGSDPVRYWGLVGVSGSKLGIGLSWDVRFSWGIGSSWDVKPDTRGWISQ